MALKRIAIMGSTGSIGKSALDVVARHKDLFQVTAITAWNNVATLKEQVIKFRPKVVCLMDEAKAMDLKNDPTFRGVDVLWGVSGLVEVATREDVDLVVSAIVGSAGLVPTYAAVEAGKDIALANKETLVAAGRIVMEEAQRRGVSIIPVDSEHNAIYQSLKGHRKEDVRRLILTASGGPFIDKTESELKCVTATEALNHPTWSMGDKITIDSATLMNKGLEVIEARWLFDVSPDKIDVIIHRESIVHSMVEYVDGSVIAQMGVPDMRAPIAYALFYPERRDSGVSYLDLCDKGSLSFTEPDTKRFPALELCYKAMDMGGTTPAVASAANEVAVNAFLGGNIAFDGIPSVIQDVMTDHNPIDAKNIDEVIKADLWARRRADEMINSMKGRN